MSRAIMSSNLYALLSDAYKGKLTRITPEELDQRTFGSALRRAYFMPGDEPGSFQLTQVGLEEYKRYSEGHAPMRSEARELSALVASLLHVRNTRRERNTKRLKEVKRRSARRTNQAA